MSKFLKLIPVLTCLLLSSCAWSTKGRGPVMWLSYYVLDQSDDQADSHTPTDPMPEYHHTGEKRILSIEPSTAGIIMFLPAAVIDIIALPATALYAAFDQSWRGPAAKKY